MFLHLITDIVPESSQGVPKIGKVFFYLRFDLREEVYITIINSCIFCVSYAYCNHGSNC